MKISYFWVKYGCIMDEKLQFDFLTSQEIIKKENS